MTREKRVPDAAPAAGITGASPEVRPAAAFPIVGIGASAGGLAAFEAFFSGMPPGTEPGMAFVLVQHLAPDHESILSDLLARHTSMRVLEVEDGMPLSVNCVYIIPPNRDMAVLDGRLQLLEPSAPRGQRLPIDFFLRSLAQDQHERAIGIVLSGTGSDGTLGVRAIKGEGGMVMAQAPDSSAYDGMPRSAIATGLVDFVLPPGEMPAQLLAYVSRAIGLPPRAQALPSPATDHEMKKVFILLRAQTGHDFNHYKPNTIGRRVGRRMAVHQIDRLDEYVRYLQQTPAEVDALFRDLLIGVTSFFRDAEAFAALQQHVIPALFRGRLVGKAIRIWVPGCSTGEEAYSIAILLQEYVAKAKQQSRVQIFATDIDRRAVDHTRAGIYPASVAADISEERLARFFIQEPGGGSYRVCKPIRDMLVVSEQDMVLDPPFSRLDLISCRNVLIYMGPELQKRLIPLFHYALNPGGFLFLGTSETVGEQADLFATVDRPSKLYRSQEGIVGPRRPSFGRSGGRRRDGVALVAEPGRVTDGARLSVRELTERALLQHHSPCGALVAEDGDILYLHGRTGLYLEPAPGESGMNILKMAREGLRRDLSTALHTAAAHDAPASHAGVRVKTNGEYATINLTVRPVATGSDTPALTRLFLVVFEPSQAPDVGDAATLAPPVDATPSDPSETDARVAELQRELRSREEYLQAANEELETSNEELRSSNEEMQSVNEELQSTNEELETSKEELQSVNEELATVNAELQNKVADLSRVNNDMNNLLAGTGIGTIFVDEHLHIQRFTPAVTQIINLIQSDVGRPVGHIVSNLAGYDRLVGDVQAVLDSLIPRDVEVQTRAGAWYLLRIRPYRTLENVIEGAVITFTDITALKRAEAALREVEMQRRASAGDAGSPTVESEGHSR
jgi:two-component system CheB/CheR fusion protein